MNTELLVTIDSHGRGVLSLTTMPADAFLTIAPLGAPQAHPPQAVGVAA
jgi:hypothetical protein